MARTATERSLARLQRIRERGGAVLNIRVGADALERLRTLAANHDCTLQDVVEGLLVGAVQANPERLSPSERQAVAA